MKRPFAVIGLSCFFVLLVLCLAGSADAAFLCFGITVFGAILLLINRKRTQTGFVPLCLLAAALACVLFVSGNMQLLKTEGFAGKEIYVEGTVSERPYSIEGGKRWYCVFECEKINGINVKGKLRISFSPTRDELEPDRLEVGNRVTFDATAYSTVENVNGVNEYLLSKRIFLGAYAVKNLTVVKSGISISGHFAKIRQYVTQKLRYGFSDRIAGLVVGILTGDKSCLDDRLYEAFRKSGVAHILAVSGLHLSLWVFVLDNARIQSKGVKKLKQLFLIGTVLFIMLLAGMSESVKRAGFMYIVMLVGRLFNKQSDSLNSLGFTLLIMMLYNPYCVLSVSLQLSFLSTLGIITLGNFYIKSMQSAKDKIPAGRLMTRIFSSCADSFFISISVLIFTFPVVVYNFGGISTVSAWVNILILFAISPLMVLSGLYVIFADVVFISYPIAIAVKFIGEYVIFVTEFFSSFENAFLPFSEENLYRYILAFVTVGLISLLAFRAKRKKEFFKM